VCIILDWAVRYLCSTLDLRGYLELRPGDALFARPIDKEGDKSFDCLQVLVGIRYALVEFLV
jgi:hypothetical protein